MMTYWVNFIKIGDPNGPGLVTYPAYDTAADKNLHFGDTIQVEQHLYGSACDYINTVSRFRPH